MHLNRTVLLPTGLSMTFGIGVPRSTQPFRAAVTLRDNQFFPAELVVPADCPVLIALTSDDTLGVPFGTPDLRIESVASSGQRALIRLQPLALGHYSLAVGNIAEPAQATLTVIAAD